MVVAEISFGLTSLQNIADIAKAMMGLRDAEAFRAKSIELQGVVLEAMEKAIQANQAQAEQVERVRALEAEVARLKEWSAEKERYELKAVGERAQAYMLKPDARGSEPPHWLCPNCYASGKKSFLQPNGKQEQRHHFYACAHCKTILLSHLKPQWIDEVMV